MESVCGAYYGLRRATKSGGSGGRRGIGPMRHAAHAARMQWLHNLRSAGPAAAHISALLLVLQAGSQQQFMAGVIMPCRAERLERI